MEIFQLANQIDLKTVVKETVKEIAEGVSILTDDLIISAENNTKTREEYIAYMKGAAFVFYRLAKRYSPYSGTPIRISTIEEAIQHCIKLLPFMERDEKIEHMYLIQWLNKLLKIETGKEITYPKEYLTDNEIREAYDEFCKRNHLTKHF